MVVEECVVNEWWFIFTHKYLYNASHYFTDLMVYKTLTFDSKLQPFIIYLLTTKLHNIPFGFGIFRFQIPTIIMEIMSSNKFRTTLINLLQYIYLIIYLIFFNEICIWTHITIYTRFYHWSYIKSTSNSTNCMNNNFCIFKYFFKFY